MLRVFVLLNNLIKTVYCLNFYLFTLNIFHIYYVHSFSFEQYILSDLKTVRISFPIEKMKLKQHAVSRFSGQALFLFRLVP